ncbi:hypothetical protein S101447_01727 [Acetobacter ascendens]|uniref:Uncharacterized protein n=1 Tax=Acetobacter ascendens TaxID=481146 RepID=A0A1Y0V3Z8_9PROT|nr:hypothetical protein S101447_01727 [Acetobacter ascendens]
MSPCPTVFSQTSSPGFEDADFGRAKVAPSGAHPATSEGPHKKWRIIVVFLRFACALRTKMRYRALNADFLDRIALLNEILTSFLDIFLVFDLSLSQHQIEFFLSSIRPDLSCFCPSADTISF